MRAELSDARDEVDDDLRRFFEACKAGHDTVDARGARLAPCMGGSFAGALSRWLGDGALERAHGDESERNSALDACGGGEAAGGTRAVSKAAVVGAGGARRAAFGPCGRSTVGDVARVLLDPLTRLSTLARFFSRVASSPPLGRTSVVEASPSRTPSAFSSRSTHPLTSLSYFSWLSSPAPLVSCSDKLPIAASRTAAFHMWSTSAAAVEGAAPTASCATSWSLSSERGDAPESGERVGLVRRGKRSS